MRFKGLLIVRLGPYFTWLNISGFQSPWDHFWGHNRILKLKFKKSDAPKILRWTKVVCANPPRALKYLGSRETIFWELQGEIIYKWALQETSGWKIDFKNVIWILFDQSNVLREMYTNVNALAHDEIKIFSFKSLAHEQLKVWVSYEKMNCHNYKIDSSKYC